MTEQTLYKVFFTPEEHHELLGLFKQSLDELSSGDSRDRLRPDDWNAKLVDHNIFTALSHAEIVSLEIDLFEH